MSCPEEKVENTGEHVPYNGIVVSNLFGGAAPLEPRLPGWTKYTGCGKTTLCFDDVEPGMPADRCARPVGPPADAIAKSIAEEGYRLKRQGCDDEVRAVPFTWHWRLEACGDALICAAREEYRVNRFSGPESEVLTFCEFAPAVSKVGDAMRDLAKKYRLAALRSIFYEPTFVEAHQGDYGTIADLLVDNDETGAIAFIELVDHVALWRRFVASHTSAAAHARLGRWLFLHKFGTAGLIEMLEAKRTATKITGSLHLWLGELLADNGFLDEARTELDAELLENPDNLEAKDARALLP